MTTTFLSKVTNSAPALPSRVVLYAGEKWGKSSWATHSPKPIFLMTAGETGLLSLIESGKVPATPHFPEDFRNWSSLLAAVRELSNERHDFKTLILDTGNGAENLCAQHVCDENFQGDWTGFNSYGRGNEIATKVWAQFLALLDEVRLKRSMSVIILHHAKVKTFSDPAGKSWDQWRPEAIEKLWGLTHKWADVILFGGFEVSVNRDDKATGESRYLQSSSSAAIIAGSRYGLPDRIKASPGAGNMWTAFADAMRKAKGGGKAAGGSVNTAPAAEPAPKKPAREPGDEPDDEPVSSSTSANPEIPY